MGRRSDHTRQELAELFVEEGWRQLSRVGLARFSARDVAKKVGYSIGSLYNVFGSADLLLVAINGRTLRLWGRHLSARMAAAGEDRISSLVHGYFDFAADNPHTWVAIYEHRLADGEPYPEWYQMCVAEIMGVIETEVAAALPRASEAQVSALSRSLAATVHGHCVFMLYRTFELLAEGGPVQAALNRVREALDAANRAQPERAPSADLSAPLV